MNTMMRRGLMLVVPLVIFGAFYTMVQDTPAWKGDGIGLPEGEGQLDPIVAGIFDEHVVAFEVLGVLLTAAMIGALVIARPLGAGSDSDHYWNDPDNTELEPEQSLAPGAAAAAPEAVFGGEEE